MSHGQKKIWIKVIALSVVAVFLFSEVTWAAKAEFGFHFVLIQDNNPSAQEARFGDTLWQVYQAISSFFLPSAHAEVDPYPQEKSRTLPVYNPGYKWHKPNETVSGDGGLDYFSCELHKSELTEIQAGLLEEKARALVNLFMENNIYYSGEFLHMFINQASSILFGISPLKTDYPQTAPQKDKVVLGEDTTSTTSVQIDETGIKLNIQNQQTGIVKTEEIKLIQGAYTADLYNHGPPLINCAVYALSQLLPNVALSVLAEKLVPYTQEGHTSLYGIQQVAAEYGLILFGSKLSYTDLTQIQEPTIVHLNQDQGHFVVVTNAAEDTVTYLDNGILTSALREDFEAEWTGYALTNQGEALASEEVKVIVGATDDSQKPDPVLLAMQARLEKSGYEAAVAKKDANVYLQNIDKVLCEIGDYALILTDKDVTKDSIYFEAIKNTLQSKYPKAFSGTVNTTSKGQTRYYIDENGNVVIKKVEDTTQNGTAVIGPLEWLALLSSGGLIQGGAVGIGSCGSPTITGTLAKNGKDFFMQVDVWTGVGDPNNTHISRDYWNTLTQYEVNSFNTKAAKAGGKVIIEEDPITVKLNLCASPVEGAPSQECLDSAELKFLRFLANTNTRLTLNGWTKDGTVQDGYDFDVVGLGKWDYEPWHPVEWIVEINPINGPPATGNSLDEINFLLLEPPDTPIINCAVHSLSQLLPTVDPLALAEALQPYTREDKQTSLYGIQQVAAQYGLNLVAAKLTYEDLRQQQGSTIVHLDLGNGKGHFVVVTHATEDTVTYIDNGILRAASREEFESEWRGYGLTKESGSAKVLTQEELKQTVGAANDSQKPDPALLAMQTRKKRQVMRQVLPKKIRASILRIWTRCSAQLVSMP